VIFGRKDHLLLIDCASLERQLIPMASEDVSIVVINTMVKHALGDGGYKSRRADCEEAARTMGVSFLRELKPEHLGELAVRLPERLFRRARHVVTENERTLAAAAAIRAGEWMKVGELMYASHDSLRDDFEVSCVELDLVVETARGIGAGGGVQGCRMTGGGFGGCCVALVNRDATSAVTQTIAARYKERTGIEATIFVTRPADGARILTHP
jgi:galactokinase